LLTSNPIKRAFLALTLIACLIVVQSCGSSKVVIGRAEPRESSEEVKKAPEKAKEAPAQKAEEEKAAPAKAPEPEKKARGGMMGMVTPKTEAPKPEETKPAEPAPAETKPAETKAAEAAPAETKSAETKAAEAAPAEPKPAETKVADAAPAEPKPADSSAQDTTAPQSSPAKPRPAPPAEEPKPAIPAPYKLDLSFGGFGLGVGLFDNPVSVQVDEFENIYVIDQGNFRIEKFDRFGLFQFAFGRQGMGDGEFVTGKLPPPSTDSALRMTGEIEFNKPIGMLLDKDDTRNLIRIHVVDSLNNRIQRLLLLQNPPADRFPPDNGGPSDVFVLLTKNEGVKMDAPPFIMSGSLQEKFEKENRPVILDPLYIAKANPTLLAPFIWGGLGFTQGQLNNPTYLTKDDNSILWVSDTENGRVEGFYISPGDPSRDATFYREFGNDINLPRGAGHLNQPTAIAFDNSGFGGFLVLDKLEGGAYNIQKFDREGRFTGVFATSGDKEGQFKQPVSIALNPSDNTAFITDRARRKVMVFNNKGEFMYEFGGDELADPRGVAVLRNNYVYVTDAAKNMVYRYVPQ
jgi:hypothetical protein